MTASRFTETTRIELLVAVGAGASLEDACLRAGISTHTVQGWLRRGRGERGTAHAAFATAVDVARAGREVPRGEMTEAEFNEHLDTAVRAGSIQAMKLWADHRASDKPQAPAHPLDDLAERRRRR